MIDLHLHTTASDGALAPADLVRRAAAAGLTTISVTDHDTIGGLREATTAARELGLTCIPGIEITAVERDRDVHVLGYFFDPDAPSLERFLRAQRADRVRRVREMCDRLAAGGLDVRADSALSAPADASERSIGRPAIADALVRAGLARSRDDAFERLIGRGGPAYVPRRGLPVGEVVQLIAAAGGIASLAHPVLAGLDHLVPELARIGLAALEARHSDHSPAVEARYRAMAGELALAVSGGSDFHGDDTPNGAALGIVTLDAADYAALESRAHARH